MSSAATRHRAPITLTLSPGALATLTQLGGGRDRSAVVEALLEAHLAGDVRDFATYLDVVTQERREAQRARGLAARGNLRGGQRTNPTAVSGV